MMIAGLLPYTGFELVEHCWCSLDAICDVVIVRLDGVDSFPFDSPKVSTFTADAPWDRAIYHEELLRRLDTIGPDVVVALDEDESFEMPMGNELWRWWRTTAPTMFFSYAPMPTDDGRRVDIYPLLPHCKIFHWRLGLSYLPYQGCDQVFQYIHAPRFMSTVRLLHWCHYTQEMERRHRVQIAKHYAAEIARGMPW